MISACFCQSSSLYAANYDNRWWRARRAKLCRCSAVPSSIRRSQVAQPQVAQPQVAQPQVATPPSCQAPSCPAQGPKAQNGKGPGKF